MIVGLPSSKAPTGQYPVRQGRPKDSLPPLSSGQKIRKIGLSRARSRVGWALVLFVETHRAVRAGRSCGS
jgi:hypothetical protein